MIEARLPKRTSDNWGQGHFGAPRNGRKHNGIDYCCPPGTEVYSPVVGTVTKHGYPYADDLSFRYIEITCDHNKVKHRLFYVDPCMDVGSKVRRNTLVGMSQKLGDRYEGITEHIHYEVKTQDGEYLDPEEWFN